MWFGTCMQGRLNNLGLRFTRLRDPGSVRDPCQPGVPHWYPMRVRSRSMKHLAQPTASPLPAALPFQSLYQRYSRNPPRLRELYWPRDGQQKV